MHENRYHVSCVHDAIPFLCSTCCWTSVTRTVLRNETICPPMLLAFILVVQGNMSMLSNKLKSSKTLVAFRCNHCKGEYKTQCAYDCHRQYPSTLHTPCSDTRNQRSITFTQWQDLATGILQELAVSNFGNICHNACDLCCNGMNHELHFHYISCT